MRFIRLDKGKHGEKRLLGSQCVPQVEESFARGSVMERG
jgi:hypothetical protein